MLSGRETAGPLSLQNLVRALFVDSQSVENALVFSKVLVTGFHVGPVAGTRPQRFVWVLPVRGCEGALDVHPAAPVCDYVVVIVDLRLRPISNDLPCSFQICLDLVSGHVITAGLLSERTAQMPGPPRSILQQRTVSGPG